MLFISLNTESFYLVFVPLASGGIYVWHMHADLIKIFGDDSILQFGEGNLWAPFE